MEKRIIWNTEMINSTTDKLNDGFIYPAAENPYFDKVIGLRKNNLTFEYSEKELEEYTKCKIDVIYFANNYCQVKSEDGQFHPLKLRDYQHDMLNLFCDNKLSILMASRQIGKCFLYNTPLVIYNKKLKVYTNMKFFKFLFKVKIERSIYDYIKYGLYSLIDLIDG